MAGQPRKRMRELQQQGWNGKVLPAVDGSLQGPPPPPMPQTPAARPPSFPNVTRPQPAPPFVAHPQSNYVAPAPRPSTGPRAPGAGLPNFGDVRPGAYTVAPNTEPPFAEAPPEGASSHADASNAYAQRMRWRADLKWRRSGNVPQGDNHLVHAWAHAITQYAPYALEVWLTRTEPSANAYQLVIAGEELMGDWPDRVLYNAVCRKRRQPTIFERFSGRIRARSESGELIELAGGDISLPPDAAQANTQWGSGATPWGQPGAQPWGQPYGYGPPGMSGPYGAAPGFGPPGYGAPPPWWGAPPPWWQQAAPMTAAPPPPAIQENPAMLEMWRMLTTTLQQATSNGNQSQADLTRMLLERLLTQPAAAAKSENNLDSLLSMVDKFTSITERLRGPQQESAPFSVHHMPDGTTMIANSKGLDKEATLGLGIVSAVKDGVKEIVRTRAARAGASSGGPRAPGALPAATGGPSVPAAPNGSPAKSPS